jgi:anti-sigma factor RsiW
MNCRRAERLLSHYLEGRLGRWEAAGMAAHLQDCRSCRRFREEIAAVEAELRECPDPPPPPGIERRAVCRWVAERERSGLRPVLVPLVGWSSVRRSPLRAAVLMAILLLAVLGLELPASGHRAPGPVLLSQAPGGPAISPPRKV